MATIVPYLLDEDNYQYWRIFVKNYLLAQDLWQIVESSETIDSFSSVDLNSSPDEIVNWGRKNAAALHAIHMSCSPQIFAQIMDISSAKDAWDELSYMHEEQQFKLESETSVEEPHTEEEFDMTRRAHCAELRKGIYKGDWDVVNQFLDKYPINTILGDRIGTVLHLAILAGEDKIAMQLIDMMSTEDLEIQDHNGNTALNLVAYEGITSVAEFLVEKNRNLLLILNNDGEIPVVRACAVGQKEMTHYLYSVTPFELLRPENGFHGLLLMCSGIANEMFGKNFYNVLF